VQELKDRIREQGRNLGNGIIKVDGFLTHQVYLHLMTLAGRELARRFTHTGANKVLTVEISGIAPAVLTALAMQVPLVFARKAKPITMPSQVYETTAPSHTKGGLVPIIISPEYLGPGDRVLIVDDFLATGQTIAALARLVQESGASLVGIGAVIEKSFEGGRQHLSPLNVPIESLVVIERMDDHQIVFAH